MMAKLERGDRGMVEMNKGNHLASSPMAMNGREAQESERRAEVSRSTRNPSKIGGLSRSFLWPAGSVALLAHQEGMMHRCETGPRW
jgi:hypothetical protein